jgi:hypothetical protein
MEITAVCLESRTNIENILCGWDKVFSNVTTGGINTQCSNYWVLKE